MAAEKIQTCGDLRAYYGEINPRAARKQMPKLDAHARNFIAHSPFMVIASAGPSGSDASPKGDAPGFVQVLDERTLLIPDRPGNNRVDTMGNILDNPRVALLFLVPGVNESLRVNGRARITTDEALLRPLAVQGKAPRSGLLVEVEEVFLHCGKALIRSKLWDAGRHVDRRSFPSMGQMLADQIGGLDPEAVQKEVEERYRTGLY